MPVDRRRRGDLQAIGGAVRSQLSRFGPQAGMAEILAAWPGAVGQAIAHNAWPARIGKDGTVHVHTTDSIWGFELGHRSAEIAAKLGVPAIRFAPGPLPEVAPEEVEQVLVAPGPEDVERARAIVASISDPELRETVQKAVSFSLARGASDPRT